jgi:hypothetical protein
VLDLDLPHQVAHVDERGVPQLLLGKQRAALEVELIELGQNAEDLHAVVDFEQLDHFRNIDFAVGGVRGDFLKENMMDVDE